MSAFDHQFLIIEQDPKLKRQITAFLESRGYRQIHETSRVKEALDVLNEHPIDCIISEWDLPLASGYSLLKLIRNQEKFKSLVYILTSEADLHHQEKILRAASQKVNGFLLKPFNLLTLERILHANGIE